MGFVFQRNLMQLLAPVFKKETITENQERNSQKMLPCLKGDHFLQEGENPRAWRKGRKFNDVSEDTSRWTSDSFFPKWEKITKKKWVLSVIKEGYKLEFLQKPPFQGIKVHSKTNNKNSDLLKAEINSLIEKNAIEIVPRLETQSGFYKKFLRNVSCQGTTRRDRRFFEEAG
jgi:hypothetical protein